MSTTLVVPEDTSTADGKGPTARLEGRNAEISPRKFGSLRGRVSVDTTFFAPLPDEELSAWEGD